MNEKIPETARQKFIRNTEEDIRIMRSRAVEAQRENRFDDAARTTKVVDTWQQILDGAIEAESSQ